jgi:hypothetical protein
MFSSGAVPSPQTLSLPSCWLSHAPSTSRKYGLIKVWMPWLNVPQLNVPWTFCLKLNVPWTFRLKWHFVPVTFGPSWGGLYVHSSHHHFCLEKGMLSHNVTFHLFLLWPAQIWWHFVYLIQVVHPMTVQHKWDMMSTLSHVVHPVTLCPACDIFPHWYIISILIQFIYFKHFTHSVTFSPL